MQRLQAFVDRLRRSPRLLGALVGLAALIFVVLVALTLITTPEHSFSVTCMECNGRYGDLVIVDSDDLVTQRITTVVQVTDEQGMAVANATVALTSEYDKAQVKTNQSGLAMLGVNATLPANAAETFLSLSVSKSNFHDYHDDAIVTVVRQ